MDNLATLVVTMSNPWGPPQQPYRDVRTPQPTPGTTPLGSQPPAAVSITSYGPPPSKVTPAIILVVAAVSIVLGVVGYGVASRAQPVATPTPTPSRTAEPTSTRSGGVPFEARSDGAQGYWLVSAARWSGDRLTVTLSVTVDQGQTKPSFYVFGNADSRVYDAELTAPSPAFGAPTLRQGETASGNIVFVMPRGAATLVLTDSGGRQISALPIKG